MWHHAPEHRLAATGAYMVTAGTYQRVPLLASPERRDALQLMLFELAERYSWSLQAWAILANHYHFIATRQPDAVSLPAFIRALHARTAVEANRADRTPGRKVWFQYWDSHITFPRSYYARLNYVHNNPVHHRAVTRAADYPWCSAGWFEREATSSFHRMVTGFRYDRLDVPDDY